MSESKRILVVDDDALMRRSISVLLRSCGYDDILSAGDGREGLTMFRENKPDLMLLDLRMPVMDGLELLKEVGEELAEVPVIILSGVGSVDDVIMSLKLGAWDYIVKPIGDFSILDHAIKKALERAQLIKENRRYQEYLEEEVKKRTNELYQAQKMEAVGTLAGGIAHDFNNLLASIIGYAEMAMEQLSADGQPHKDLENVLIAANSATELVKQILTFSRQGKMETHPVHVQEILNQVIKFITATFPSSIEIHASIDNDCKPVLADSSQLQQVIMNLCTNARQAIPDSVGSIAISLSPVDKLPEYISLETGRKEHDEYLKIVVSDTGCGIDAGSINRIYEPFFTTKPIGQGTGLGLAVAHGIIAEMDGHIHVASTPGKGTEFQVFLPVVSFLESPEEKAEGIIPGGSERILLVDDDPRIVRILERSLSGLGYEITSFTESPAALDQFASHPDGYDLILTDMTMPRLTGKDLAREILKIRPDIAIVMCTGYSEDIDGKQAREMGIRKLVMKPIVKRELAETIRTILDNG